MEQSADLLRTLSNALRNISFNNDVELKAWLDDFYQQGIKKLFGHSKQVVNNNGIHDWLIY